MENSRDTPLPSWNPSVGSELQWQQMTHRINPTVNLTITIFVNEIRNWVFDRKMLFIYC